MIDHAKAITGTKISLTILVVGICINFSVVSAQTAAVVPPELPVQSNPDFLLNERSDDPLSNRFPWIPKPLYLSESGTIGPMDVDWVWPDIALVDWNRDGLLDVVTTLGAGTYDHRPSDQRFRALVSLNSGERVDDVPVFEQPFQTDLGYPLGSMVFDDLDGDGSLEMLTWSRNRFRLYHDTSTEGPRKFEFVCNLQDFGSGINLNTLEKGSMGPSLSLVDWDGDGMKDLIVGLRGGRVKYYPEKELGFNKGFAQDGTWIGGDRIGAVYFHKNLGKINGEWQFTTGTRILAGEDSRAMSFYDTSTAAITDWDGDGLLDMLVASFDQLLFYKNIGSAKKPKLASGKIIEVAGKRHLPAERVMVIVANWGPNDKHNLILQGSSFPWYLKNEGAANKPVFPEVKRLLMKNAPVSGGDFAVPSVGDLNGDGKPDLVIGNEDGFVTYYENQGARNAPTKFKQGEYLKSDGKVLRIETEFGMQGPAEGRWGYTSPVLVDWDGDKDLDLLLGSAHSYFLFYENIGSRKEPLFGKGLPLTYEGKVLGVVWRTRPAFHDVDKDGLEDLIFVDSLGLLSVAIRSKDNEGNVQLASISNILDSDGKPIVLDGERRETGRTTLTVMDWDNDGRHDIIAGNAVENFDGLRWYRNVGKGSDWVLERQPNLALNLPWNHYHLIEPVDWNKDGKLDLIAGSEGGWIYYYQQK